MIVLDEQLLGRNIETEIEKWYKGIVLFVIELRPGTVIKDDAIPKLLHKQNQPTFVTINEKDFWRKATIDDKCCLVCFTLPDSRADEISEALRELFRHPEFSTKAKRMGKVIRVTDREISYYTSRERQIRRC